MRSVSEASRLLPVRLRLGQPRYADGHIMTAAELIPDRAPREGLGFFEQGQTCGQVAVGFGFAELLGGFKQGEKEGFLGGADADDPGGHTVDARVEVVEADAGAAEEIAADQLFHHRACRVIEDHHVIAVPAHAAANVEQQAGDEEEHGGNLVGESFGRVEVSRIQADGFLS